MYEAVHGWEYPQIWTAFDLYLWDKKDKKDSQNSGRSPTCNLPPPELTSHTLFVEGDGVDEYIRQLQAYVREYKIIFEEDCPQPCLDALWWHYGEYHNMDSSQAKKGFKNLRACLDSLPIKDSDVVVGEVGCLCAEYERIAFTAGLKLGAQLMLELTENATGK